MAINRVDYPASTPASLTDWTDNISLHEASFLRTEESQRIDYANDNVFQGAVFQIGGSVYLADADTAITGTASDYVKITPSGATASAAYVADLTGVSWNAVYNGWYDGSGNLYVFDEGKAKAAGEITEVHGRYLMQQANGEIYTGGTVNAPTVNTGQGDYNLGQNTRTTDGVTFATVNARGMDTFGGFYQGSTQDETDLPVGSIVGAFLGTESTPVRNESKTVYTRGTTQYTLDSSLSNGTMSGTWRTRGITAQDYYLMQRVS
jgi:hypothetical protein